MALPPITNTPIIKTVSGTQDKPAARKAGDGSTASSAQDTVTLSPEAQKLLDENKIQNDAQARQAASDIGNTLSKDQNLTLAKDPSAL